MFEKDFVLRAAGHGYLYYLPYRAVAEVRRPGQPPVLVTDLVGELVDADLLETAYAPATAERVPLVTTAQGDQALELLRRIEEQRLIAVLAAA